MDIVEYDNTKLIEFYIKNGLEFSNTRGYYGNDVKSLAIVKDNEVIGAISIAKYKEKSFIEAIAVKKEYRHNQIGKKLIKQAIKELAKPVYTISKVDNFFEKNGFLYNDNEDFINENCKSCEEYNVTCFPKVMIYK